MKVEKFTDNKGGEHYWWHCPGCNGTHSIDHRWAFNGNYESPTFSPSYKATTPETVCHVFIRDGKIQYLGDCTHELRGQTIDMVDFNDINDGEA